MTETGKEPSMTPDEPADEGLDAAMDPAAALELLTNEQNRMQRRMAAGLPVILGAWGIAWSVGFTMLWLIDGLAPGFRMPLAIAVAAFIVLMAGAVVVSAVAGARMGRGIRAGASAAWTGAVFGLTWPIGFVAIFVLGSALLSAGMSREVANIYYPTASVMFVGIMYFIAGGVWQNWGSIVMGGWIVLVACVAPFFGYPTHYLVFAVAGGGVFLVATVVTAIWAYGRRDSGTGRR
jgi:hypothetical protein